ncbi:alpha-amylase [Spirochaetia bacterium]|nr:alpha-amylase [Spirochaetia bacterium]
MTGARREFHICNAVRAESALEAPLFSLTGNVLLADFRKTRALAAKLNEGHPERAVRAGDLNAMGLIDEILHFLTKLYRERIQPDLFEAGVTRITEKAGPDRTDELLQTFTMQFPPRDVYAGSETRDHYLAGTTEGESHRALSLEEMLLLALANLNPAFSPFLFMFDDSDLERQTIYPQAIKELQNYLQSLPGFGPDGQNLWDMLRAPALASPDSLAGQLNFMRRKWGMLLKHFTGRMLTGLDVIKEEHKPVFSGPGSAEAYTYTGLGLDEYERFSPDQDWMPKTVLLAKSTLVWLFQLSQKYGREIARLDQIPDEELDLLSHRGFTGIWLIGIWERSVASKTIKQWTGNPDAAASAYSLYDYDIASELGGWPALTNLRERCAQRGLRLGSDMVPNHTGIDSRWVIEHPDRFLQLPYPPFPSYNYNCGNLSGRNDVTVQIEGHYFTRNDAAVVFKRIDNNTGETRYIYHGNDGTSMPWNDTAQIDFLNPEAREAVIQTIIGVCKQFPIVRFDAAMTLAKRHIQRLWYPEPGHGGDISSRGEHAISNDEFNRRIPNEFWREVVDRCAVEAPGTLLLAEAFWMMEGYFVRTLGMHRVYNSAFMNMLKNEDNQKYRATIKNTLEFDPEVLKRFVNFMNNPDEETAVVQFGKGDKYFGICTLLVTMPGLPLFGHGQVEGFEEKYGMEYRRSYRDEKPDSYLIERHEREIFPLMKRRAIFSGSSNFCLYDFYTSDGSVNENVFAYTNRSGMDRALVFFNNSYYQSSGWIRVSAAAIPQKNATIRRDDLFQALLLHADDNSFTAMREQHSGQWFLRSSKDIAEHGFFVMLSGYESQVFIDIHEKIDTDGTWARLNHQLNGKGVPNLEIAAQDLEFGTLYEAFTALFAPEYIAEHKAEQLKKPVEDFLNVVLSMVPESKEKPKCEKLWEEYESYLGRLDELTTIKQDRLTKAAKTLLAALAEQKPASMPYVLAYGVFSLFRSITGSGEKAKQQILAWHLDRKIRGVLINLGADPVESGRIVTLMLTILQRTGVEPVEPLTAESLVTEYYQDEDFRQILGVNVFEDTTWFNKEAFELSLMYAPLFLIVESDAAFKSPRSPGGKIQKKRLESIAAISNDLHNAKSDSGYQLDKLLTRLQTPDQPKQKAEKK